MVKKTIFLVLIIHIIGLKNVRKINKASLVMNIVLYVLIGVGITGGYHRLYTHNSYDANILIRRIILLLGAGAFQNSAIEWCSRHRMHHRFENTDKSLDPYSIQKYCNDECNTICRKPHMILNFLHAHILFVFKDESSKFKMNKNKIIDEMKNNEWKEDYSVLLLQQKYYWLISVSVAIIIPVLLSKKVLKDTWESAIGATFLRIIWVWHSAFSINSLCHLFGERENKKITAANNHLCSILTFGEGYHNYHHQYPKDYYASKNLAGFNVTAWLLRSLKFSGLIRNAKRGIMGKPGEYKIQS